LAHGLSRRDLDVAVLSAFPPPLRAPVIPDVVLHKSDWRDDPVRRIRNHLGDLVARPSDRLRDALWSIRPDVVHTNNLVGITTGIWQTANELGIPVVHTLHDYHLLCPKVTLMKSDDEMCRPHPLLCGLRTRRLARWTHAVSHVIGVSRFVLAKHAVLFSEAQCHVVRHPVESRAGKPRTPPRERLATIGYIGSLSRPKGVRLLLEALPSLAELGVRLRIAGDGRMRDEVEAAAAAGPTLHYDGPIAGEQKDAFFEECDLGVVPSVWDEPGGPPYTVLEWLAAGRPVLVSSRGGLGEVGELSRGALTLTPTREGIVEAVRNLRSPNRWRDAVARVAPQPDGDADQERWIGDHERIYQAAVLPGVDRT
jgi:glycosyltransferase involved in cell wall biosynthesis